MKKHQLIDQLTNNDLTELLTLSHRSLGCKNHEDLNALVIDLNKLFYFENAVCAQGNVLELVQSNQEPDIDVCDISYPEGYLDLYFENQYYYTDAVFCEFITNLSPVNWFEVDKQCNFNYPAAVMALDFGMKDGWTHGALDPDTMNCSAFFFGGPYAENNFRTVKILEYIIPFYSEAYKRILNKATKTTQNLTMREIEVLNWIKVGKSSWEISVILNCSKRAVDFHVTNVKKKLKAFNRAQAVAIALQHSIIEF